MGDKWYTNKPFLMELFVWSNFAFLIIDVFIAHSVNAFSHSSEWIPFYFSIIAALVLGIGFLGPEKDFRRGWRRVIGMVIGWCAILVGIAGLTFHLESQFFQAVSLRSLVYTAPLIAPLSFAGLGFLLLLNRMVEWESQDWGRWVVFFGWGGFVGNFLLALTDHAQNGFFYVSEWIPVVSCALAIGFLWMALGAESSQLFLKYCLGILVLQILVGITGFGLHLIADLQGPSGSMKDNFLYGAPVFAPLLLADLAVLAALGVWDLQSKEALDIQKI